MINIYLCEDNEILLNKYKNEISSLLSNEQIPFFIHTFLNAESLIFNIFDNLHEVDIIYLDIEMGETNGIEAAKKIRDMKYYGEIIFLTSCSEYVFDSFDVDPLHFIVKNKIDSDKFKTILLKAVNKAEKKSKEYFDFEIKGTLQRIPFHEIYFFEVHNRIVTINLNQSQESFYFTMDKLEEKVSEKGFVRCHRSYIVNLNHIIELKKDFLKLTNGTIIPIGNTYLKNLKSTFSKSLSSNH